MSDRKITERQPKMVCASIGSDFKNNHFAYVPLEIRKSKNSEKNTYCCIPNKICSIQ